MKKIFISLLILIFALSLCTSAFAAEKKIADFENVTKSSMSTDVLNGVLPQGVTTTVGLETSKPISGKQSLSFTFDTSTDKNAGNSGDIYLKPFGLATNWSGYDYLAIRIQNLNADEFVLFMVLLDQTAKDSTGADSVGRSVPTLSEDTKLRDTKNNEVELEFLEGTMVIPEGFNGTVYLPLHAEDMEFKYPHSAEVTVDEKSCTYATLNEIIMRFTSLEKTYEGTILFDDIKLLKASDIPAAAKTSAPVKTTPVPTTTAPATAPGTETTDPGTETTEPVTTTPDGVTTTVVGATTAGPTTGGPTNTGATTTPGSSLGWIIGIIVVVIGIAIAVFFIIKNKKKAA